MRQQLDNPDAVVARIAARQHGVLTFDQLLGAGLTPSGISRRAAAGRLHRIHRGVYAVGHVALSREGEWMAAVKASGKQAALSHRSAAELWAMLPPASGLVHVTVPGSGGRAKRPGIRLHRSLSLPQAVTTLHRAIAVTTPARTVADLRRTVDVDTVRKAIRTAEVLGLPLGDQADAGDPTRSELERRFLALCRRHRLPPPEVNVPAGPYEVDFLWRQRRLIVETDGYRYHRGRQAFDDDRARDARLAALGYDVLRFSYRQVLDEPAQVIAAIRPRLAPTARR